jgi:hypothetical protein
MIIRHPILAIWHLLDGRRDEPVQLSKKSKTEID